MFAHIFKNQLKIILRNKEVLFWVLSFPIILGFLFNLAFSNLNNAFVFKEINIAVVNDSQFQQNNSLVDSIKMLSVDGKSKIFNTQYVDNIQQANALLAKNNIDGFIKSESDEIKIHITKSGINQTIIKSVIDQTLSANNSIAKAVTVNPNVSMLDLTASFNNLGDYFDDKTNKFTDRTVLYFYTLIGMTCLYAGTFGIMAVNQNEANLSRLGMRLGASPAKKITTLLASLSAGFVVSFMGLIILYLFLSYILRINFGENWWTILITMIFGSMAGILLGTVVGVSNRFNENIKNGIMTGSTMFLSFLAGMMGSTSIKHLIDVKAPFLAYINPVNLISDSLFSTYYFGVSGRYWLNLFYLSLIIIVSVIMSWLFLRKKKYASL